MYFDLKNRLPASLQYSLAVLASRVFVKWILKALSDAASCFLSFLSSSDPSSAPESSVILFKSLKRMAFLPAPLVVDGLGMTTAAIRWKQILDAPELGNFTAQQLLREVLTPQYIEAMNKRYETNLKFSRLMEKSAQIENLKTGNVCNFLFYLSFCSPIPPHFGGNFTLSHRFPYRSSRAFRVQTS